MSLTEIARQGHITPSTLTRFRNNDERAGSLHSLTITTVAEVTGVPAAPDLLGEVTPRAGMREREAEPYQVDAGDELEAAVVGLVAGRDHVHPWTLKTRALEYAGYRPGDVVIVDLNAEPQPGDVVCAQVYDFGLGRAETVFRLFEPPFLISVGPDETDRRPRRADEDAVAVKGVVLASLRRRAARAG